MTILRLFTLIIDLLYVHQPMGDYRGAWRDMEKAVEQGKVRSLCISNFDAFLTPIMQRNTTGVKTVSTTAVNGKTEYYTLSGTRLPSPDSASGAYIQKTAEGSKKVIRR